jgi:hypothetical protein
MYFFFFLSYFKLVSSFWEGRLGLNSQKRLLSSAYMVTFITKANEFKLFE